MKVSLVTVLLCLSSSLSAFSIPQSKEISVRASAPESDYLDPRDFSTLEKRKGGGGGKGGGSGGSSSSGTKGGGSTSSGGSSGSNTGGRTVSGSGIKPAYGGRYAGGAAVPFAAGGRSPSRGYLPLALPIAAFAIFPGIWLYSSLYAYPYHYPYYYYNNGRNRTANATCLCQRYSVCGCDDDGNSTFLQNMVNNGTDRPVNTSTVRYIEYANGTAAAFINGTLPNGTTAAGGTDGSSSSSQTSGAAKLAMQYGGYWVMVGTVGATVLLL